MKRFSKQALTKLEIYMSNEDTHKHAVFLLCDQLLKSGVYLDGEEIYTDFGTPLHGFEILSYVIDKLIFESLGDFEPFVFGSVSTVALVSTFSSLFEHELQSTEVSCEAEAMSSALE